MENYKTVSNYNVKELILCSLFVAIISICSVITIHLPFSPVPVTMQTFAVFCTGLCLKRKTSAAAMMVYIFVGAVGLPVFGGYTSGLAIVLGPTGGFMFGFIAAAYLIGLIRDIGFRQELGIHSYTAFLGCILGMIVIYIFGIIQFMFVVDTNIYGALSMAVIPFILPDLLKITVAVIVYKRIFPYVS